jgi:hypothetical protein
VEKRLPKKETLSLVRRNRNGACVYDGLWAHMCAAANGTELDTEASDLEVSDTETHDSEAADLEASAPYIEYFVGMVLVVVLKSNASTESSESPSKSEDVLKAVCDSWYRVLDPEYLHGNGIEMSMINHARLGSKANKRRPEAFTRKETHKKRRIS